MDHRIKIKESKRINKYLDLARELKMLWNMKVTVIPVVVGALGIVPKALGKKTGISENRRENRNHPDYNIFKIS